VTDFHLVPTPLLTVVGMKLKRTATYKNCDSMYSQTLSRTHLETCFELVPSNRVLYEEMGSYPVVHNALFTVRIKLDLLISPLFAFLRMGLARDAKKS
jgi:hypothetical protein